MLVTTAPPRVAAERQTSLASLEALPVTNLESFEATIYPDGLVKNNISEAGAAALGSSQEQRDADVARVSQASL